MRPTTLLFWLVVLVLPWVWLFRRQPGARLAGSGPGKPAGRSEPSSTAGQEEAPSAGLEKQPLSKEVAHQLLEAQLLAFGDQEDEALSLIDRLLIRVAQEETDATDLELEVRMRRGGVLRQLKRYDEALAEYRLCQSKGHLAWDKSRRYEAAFAEGELLISLGQQQAGVRLLLSTLESNPPAQAPFQVRVLQKVAET